ncbi:piggyBac transposable element-derived protein 4-like, partial [Vespa velutina]|uniref:piggyBac transposable element-derived protein 4-like n=1 Tax=Vespa velutina TaxID=202808 RepID=UPI001FB29DFB
MANEKEDTIIHDECVDILSDVPSEFQDCGELEDITSSEKENEAISSDESEICRQKIRRTLPLSSDIEESDEDNRFSGPNVLPRDTNNIEDVVELFIGNDLKISTNADRLFKVQGIIDYFTKKFQENFNLGKNITIDEGMIPWRRRLIFKVYNPSKIIKYGILVRMLCDSVTEYISRYKIYSGIKKPLKDTCGLAEDLLTKKIRVRGTLRKNRGLPAKLKNCKLNVFETNHQRRGAVLVQVWKATKTKIITFSIRHNGGLVDTAKKSRKTNSTIKKPASILDYNKYMKGVDRADQSLSYYPIYRKTIKWSKKVALYLFNCALYNAFVLQQHYTDSKKLHFHDFLLKICESWIKDHSPVGEENLEVPSIWRASSRDSINRLFGLVKEHQLIRISETNNRKRRRCH